MAGFTNLTLMGNITRDLETKTTAGGKPVVSFTVAVNKKDDTTFIDCVAWNNTAETLAKYLKKGSPVILGGELNGRSWEKDGVKRTKLELVVRSFSFISNGSIGGDRPLKQHEVLETAYDDFNEKDDIDLTEIPF